MKKFLLGKKFQIVYSLAALILVWVIWLIAAASVKNDYLVPSFWDSAREFFALFAKGFFYKALGATILRTLIAYALSFVLALGCACLAARFKPFASFMRPLVAILRSLPTMAVLLLILVWLSPKIAPVAVAMLVLFPMTYSALFSAIGEVQGELLQMARVYNLSNGQILRGIYLPQIAPVMVEQTGDGLSFGIKLIVSAEVMASTYVALGGMMREAQIYLELPRLAALTLFAVLFGIAVECIFHLISYFAFRWKREARGD